MQLSFEPSRRLRVFLRQEVLRKISLDSASTDSLLSSPAPASTGAWTNEDRRDRSPERALRIKPV